MTSSKFSKLLKIALTGIIALAFAMTGCSNTGAITTSSPPITSVPASLTLSKPAFTPTTNLPDVNMSISLSNPNVKSGESFTADVVIDSDVLLRGAQCAIIFNPSLMKCDRVLEGGFFKVWADANGSSTIMLPQPVIDNVSGNVTDIGVAIMGTKAGGVKGSGVFCTYYFTALADGIVVPELGQALISDENGKIIPVTVGGK
jgi:hypothetical protein